MLVRDYADFVSRSDQSVGKGEHVRRDIATYGLVGEIGSLFSVVKKAKLAGGGAAAANVELAQIKEELGDVLWYCVSLAEIENPGGLDIFAIDVANLRKELGAGDARAERIGAALSERRETFLTRASTFGDAGTTTLGAYQKLAFFTARTEGEVLRAVCLAVIWQLGAEIARRLLPPFELELNKQVRDRPLNTVLGEVAWHLAALATLAGISLDDVAEANVQKVNRRYVRDAPTPLHDEGRPAQERFPRRCEIAFVTVGKGRARMYLDGRRLGDDLTDNSNDDDGYRFHDVMHLANAAKLGWSPVLRSLMARKRRSDANLDEVQDGARARIVEELIVKSIHSEGLSAHGRDGSVDPGAANELFAGRGQVSFRFLTYIGRLSLGLEVEANQLWEWEDAILAGSHLYDRLRTEGQGTITLDLEARSLEFRPEVYVDLPGAVAGIGSSTMPVTDKRLDTDAVGDREACTKAAMLDALGFDDPAKLPSSELEVRVMDSRRASVRASGRVQEAMWRKKVVSFRTTWSEINGVAACTAFAMSDPKDASV